MPSPFPGMDPYLEGPDFWRDLHQSYITYIREALNALLPPAYVAKVDERLYVQPGGGQILPDVAVLHSRTRPTPQTRQGGETNLETGGVAVAERPDDAPGESADGPSDRERSAAAPLTLTLLPDDGPSEPYIEIYKTGDRSRVVTTIELLSPSNKTSGAGRRAYVEKQREILHSPTHLLEIDLLREGQDTLVAPRPHIGADRQRRCDYLISLHRGYNRYTFELWPVRLREPLPLVLVPLDPNTPDIVLDLQTVFTRCYDASGYGRSLDYSQDAEPPLEGDDTAWADQLLREQNLRPQNAVELL